MTDSAAIAPFFAMFPGQGSQVPGMGKELCAQDSLAREIFARADDALGFSLSTLCFEGPEEELTKTAHAQPAILTMSVACFSIAQREAGGALPVVAGAGHSLGEYSALVAAGVLSFEDAVRVVHLRGKYMQEAVPVGTGKMIAVLGREPAELDQICAQIDAGVVAVANINAPGQIVVSGSSGAVDQFVSKLPTGTKSIPLAVSAPFHCSLMQPAADRLAEQLSKIPFQDARFPVIQNFSASPEKQGAQIRANLVKQVCGRVRWVECVQRAAADFGAQRCVEFGRGAVLTGMVKRIVPSMARVNVDSLASAQALKNQG